MAWSKQLIFIEVQSAVSCQDQANTCSEDSNGKVTGKYLIPRPTADPKDPLVSLIHEAIGLGILLTILDLERLAQTSCYGFDLPIRFSVQLYYCNNITNLGAYYHRF